MTSNDALDHPVSSISNRKSRRLLYIGITALAAGWGFSALVLAPAIAAPAPWTQLAELAIFGLIGLLISWKVPVSMEFRPEYVVLRRLLGSTRLNKDLITRVEYRILEPYLVRPIEARYYSISLWSSARRLADIGVDGAVVVRFMSWFDASKSILKVYRGRQLVDERPLGS